MVLNHLDTFLWVDIATPEVFVGGLLGSMFIFFITAWACAAVGPSAQEAVNAVTHLKIHYHFS